MLRSAGRNPTAKPEARAKLAADVSRRRAERIAWELDHPLAA